MPIIENSPMFQHFSIPQRESYHHKISTQFQNDLIIDIILQLNQSLYLEYLEGIVEFGPRRTGTPGCEHPKGKGKWHIAEEDRQTVKSIRGMTEGSIGTL